MTWACLVASGRKVASEEGGVCSRAHQDDLDTGIPAARQEPFQKQQEQVRIDAALVHFVHNDVRCSAQLGVGKESPQQYPCEFQGVRV